MKIIYDEIKQCYFLTYYHNDKHHFVEPFRSYNEAVKYYNVYHASRLDDLK